MSKLKILSQDDLSTISDKFGEILEKEVSKSVSMKELEDLDLDIVLNYENEQLDVNVDVGLLFDELSEITQDQVMQAIDEAYLEFDSYIDNNVKYYTIASLNEGLLYKGNNINELINNVRYILSNRFEVQFFDTELFNIVNNIK